MPSSTPDGLGDSDAIEFRDVNLVVTTDMHSWVEGRAHEPYLNASLGHVVSLVEEFRILARAARRDVFFLDNGDLNDGTGLSATSQDHVAYLAPLVQLAPYDALNIGNHELYQLNSKGALEGQACAITGLRDSGFIASWKGRYLTSNTVWASSGEPVGSRYTTLHGDFGTKLLVFGFLYNMDNHCDAVKIEDVGMVVRSTWFVEALEDHAPDSAAIVVLAHMDCRDPLVDLILRAIRGVVGARFPVQFLTGHSHRRCWERLDDFAASHEAGCKLDGVGFSAFDRTPSVEATSLDFRHADIDANTARLATAAGIGGPEALEERGQRTVDAINAARLELHLGETLGCSDRHWRAAAPLNATDSLWSFYATRVLPEALLDDGSGIKSWAIVGTGALIYDVYAGTFTIDDAYMASPFANFWFRLEGMLGETLQAMLEELNQQGRPARDASRLAADEPFPAYVSSGPVEASTRYRLVYNDFDAPYVERFLRDATRGALAPAIFRPGSNSTSVLVDWFRGRPCALAV